MRLYQSQLQLSMLLADIQKLMEVARTHVLGTICSTLTASEGSRKATYWLGWIVKNIAGLRELDCPV
jgi:hypothetical protein